MSKSKIEWTDEVFNPIVGCSKISDGCLNCYAEKMARRQTHMKTGKQAAYQSVVSNGKWNGKTAFVPSVFDKLKTLKKPRRIFVGSMCDIFHDSVKYVWHEEIFDIARSYPQHTFIFLTKRSEAMVADVKNYSLAYYAVDNFWFGVTVESQKYISRIDDLLKIPAKVRFISVEPMLSEIVIPQDKLTQLQWVICGGETGAGARQMFPEWVESLKNQCEQAEVPFFFKKWGDYAHAHPALYVDAGNLIDGFLGEFRTIDGVFQEYIHREFPKGASA